MGEDAIIKSVMFGGFDKEDVLKYIEKIQTEHLAEMEIMKQKQAETEKAWIRVKELEEQLAAESSRFSALTRLNDEYCEKIYALEEQQKELNKKFESMQEDCNRLKSVESQIGSLLLNAALYSDKITQKAKLAASGVTDDARQNIVSANEDVSRIGSDFSQAASTFSNDISAISSKIEDLSETLTSLAGRLSIENNGQEKLDKEQETFTDFFNNSENDKNTGSINEQPVSPATIDEDEPAYFSESTGYAPSAPESDDYTPDEAPQTAEEVQPEESNTQETAAEYAEDINPDEDE